jgi:hypothetical protein
MTWLGDVVLMMLAVLVAIALIAYWERTNQ